MSQPIRIHPENPKVFEYRGRPLALVTATEHYGAVMNRPFRIERYLADAAEKRMTLSRLFVLFRELQSSKNPYSTCKPDTVDYIAPFARTGPGRALDGGLKFDLDRPDPEFFDRLHRFLALAESYGIIVEVTLLSNTYGNDVWALNPLRRENNVNEMNDVPWHDYMTMRNAKLLRRQLDHVRRIVGETSRYDNVIYELCNEPGGGWKGANAPSSAEVNDWLRAIASTIREVDGGRHLVSGQEAFTYDPMELTTTLTFRDFPVDVVNVHPLPNTTYDGRAWDMGRFMSMDLRLAAFRDYCLATYAEPKPLNLDEDNAATMYREPAGWTIHRKRAWTALFSGAHYDMIDFSIVPWAEDGTPDSRRHIRTWMRHLSEYVHGMDLVRARPMPGRLREKPAHAVESVFGIEGEDWRIYLADGREWDEPGCGEPIEGKIALDVPAGAFRASFYSPETGMASPEMPANGGKTAIDLPPFRHDLVVRIRRV